MSVRDASFSTTKVFDSTVNLESCLGVNGHVWVRHTEDAESVALIPFDRNGARELRDWLTAALNDDVEEPEGAQEGDGTAVESDAMEDPRLPLATPTLVYHGTDGVEYQLDRGATPDDKREKALLEALLKLTEKPKGQLSSSSLRPVERTWS